MASELLAFREGRQLTVYSQLLESVMLPAYDYIRGRSYCRWRSLLEKSQWWTPEELQAFQWAELRRLLRHVLDNVPYYREKYAAAGISVADDVRSLDDFARLPPLSREEVNSYRTELCSRNHVGKLLPDATGGSSGVPTRFFITPQSYAWRSAATRRAYSWTGCRLGDPTLYLWGAHIGAQSRFQASKNRVHDWFRGELSISTFTQTDEFWAETWRRAYAFQPHFIVAYVSSLEQFLRHMQPERGKLRKLRAVLGAAEAVYSHLREEVRRVLKVPLFNTYGSREFMSIGVECDWHEGLHINAENLLVENEVRAGDGPSEFLITDLHNYGMPFIRYRIGDVGVLDSTPCGCGRGLPRIRSITGRSLDLLRGRDGRIVPGEFFPHLLKDVPEVAEFQVEQKSVDHILVSVVLRHALTPQSEALLNSEVQKVFGNGTRVEVRPVESIPLRLSGKRRVTIGLGT